MTTLVSESIPTIAIPTDQSGRANRTMTTNHTSNITDTCDRSFSRDLSRPSFGGNLPGLAIADHGGEIFVDLHLLNLQLRRLDYLQKKQHLRTAER